MSISPLMSGIEASFSLSVIHCAPTYAPGSRPCYMLGNRVQIGGSSRSCRVAASPYCRALSVRETWTAGVSPEVGVISTITAKNRRMLWLTKAAVSWNIPVYSVFHKPLQTWPTWPGAATRAPLHRTSAAFAYGEVKLGANLLHLFVTIRKLWLI